MVLWYLKHNFQNQDTAYKWYFDIWGSYNTSSKIRIQHTNGVLKFEAITIQFPYKNGILIFEATTIQYPKSHCFIKMVFAIWSKDNAISEIRMQYKNGIFLFETITIQFPKSDTASKWYFSIWNNYLTAQFCVAYYFNHKCLTKSPFFNIINISFWIAKLCRLYLDQSVIKVSNQISH